MNAIVQKLFNQCHFCIWNIQQGREIYIYFRQVEYKINLGLVLYFIKCIIY